MPAEGIRERFCKDRLFKMNDEELRSSYLNSLKDKLEALEKAKDDYLNDELEAKDTLRSIAHKLRGSGGTYGFPELSELAGKLEDASSDSVVVHSDNLIELVRDLIKNKL